MFFVRGTLAGGTMLGPPEKPKFFEDPEAGIIYPIILRKAK